MRDEITFVRRQLEYFGSQGNDKEKAFQELVDWLTALPEPQRMSMASSLAANNPMGVLYDEADAAMSQRLEAD